MIELNRIYNEDCLETMKRMPDNFVDLIITDPPYGIEFTGEHFKNLASDPVEKAWATRGLKIHQAPKSTPVLYKTVNPRCGECGRTVRGKSTKKGFYVCECGSGTLAPFPNSSMVRFHEYCMLWLLECFRVLKNGSHILSFGSSRMIHRIACAMEDSGFEIRDSIIWKHDAGIGRNRYTLRTAFEPVVVGRKPIRSGETPQILKGAPKTKNIFESRKALGVERSSHPTQKPLALIEDLLDVYGEDSTVVYDPFMGSGTTADACKKLGFAYIGSEISKEYCEIAEKRLQQEILV